MAGAGPLRQIAARTPGSAREAYDVSSRMGASERTFLRSGRLSVTILIASSVSLLSPLFKLLTNTSNQRPGGSTIHFPLATFRQLLRGLRRYYTPARHTVNPIILNHLMIFVLTILSAATVRSKNQSGGNSNPSTSSHAERHRLQPPTHRKLTL